ncbi:MAG: hypothetical protein DRR42_12285 [Gammaproteobacteria bacterium]|nr:MAG: hypothetical protein DRR42_12285 [Gammaproteobacteria bacterium]
MKSCILFVLTLFCLNTAWADFADAFFQLHPFSPEGRLYLIDITGEWPTDCHPGEQKPVISSYTGDTALIEFETIVEHPDCNDVLTPYRVLIDMSDVMDGTQVSPLSIDVTLRFAGTEHTETLPLVCVCSPARMPPIKPEAGLYNSKELDKQGLIIARQNLRMGVYPLIYDETGSSEWLFGGGGIDENVYFVDLNELTNGQCLGCPPPDEPPQLDVVGKLTMLMDSEGLIQVKINDSLFEEYKPEEFGYGSFQIWDPAEQIEVSIPNLSGRWAFSEAASIDASVTPPPTSVLPLVFDIKLRSSIDPPPPSTTPVPAPPEGPSSVFYGLVNMEKELVADMLCEHRGKLVCKLYAPDIGDIDEYYDVQMLSIERMLMTNTATPDQGDTAGDGTVVRID